MIDNTVAINFAVSIDHVDHVNMNGVLCVDLEQIRPIAVGVSNTDEGETETLAVGAAQHAVVCSLSGGTFGVEPHVHVVEQTRSCSVFGRAFFVRECLAFQLIPQYRDNIMVV